MRLPSLAVLAWACAASAQNRAAPVEVQLSPTGRPANSPLPALPAPLLLAPGAAPALAPALAAPSLLPAALAAAPALASPAALAARPGALSADARETALLAETKLLFGEASRPGFKSSAYLDAARPFVFGAAEVFRYRSALAVFDGGRDLDGEATLVEAAHGLARSAGIDAAPGARAAPGGGTHPTLRIMPRKDGHRLNRLAWDLDRGYGVSLEYAPRRVIGGVAAFNGAAKALFMPDFGRDDSFEAVLHESRHAMFAKRLARGDLSVYHGSLVAYEGRTVAPGALTYDRYLSLEELSTHAKTLLHAVLRAQRGGGAKAISDAKTYALQLMDVMRSIETNLGLLERRLERGELETAPVENESWPAFPGGRWEAVRMGHAAFVLPVRDEPPTPRLPWWKRPFAKAPETAGAKAVRRSVASLRPLIASFSYELEPFLAALNRGETGLPDARRSAARLTALAARADADFSASR